jgi:anaerobic selenocysteine-containing dehydrogenase
VAGRPRPPALQRRHDDPAHPQHRARRPRLAEIHPLDADRLWISDGDKVIAVDVRPMAEQPAFTPVLTPVG